MVNPIASKMASMRWAKTTPEQRAAHIQKMVKARKKQAKAARQKKDLAQG
jgi:hypothetical protein